MIPIRDHNPTAGPVVVVWGLLGANVLVFLLTWATGGQLGVLAAAYGFGLVAERLAAEPFGHAPALVTHMFLHGSWAHLIGNMIFLFVFGDNVEDVMGHARFLAFYLGGGLAAAFAQIAFMPDASLPMVGASGAVSAVLGAYLVHYPRKDVQTLVVPLVLPWLVISLLMRVPRFFLWWLPAWVYLGYWAVLQVGEGLADVAGLGGVAWWAHVGGFAFGLALGRPLARRPTPRR